MPVSPLCRARPPSWGRMWGPRGSDLRQGLVCGFEGLHCKFPSWGLRPWALRGRHGHLARGCWGQGAGLRSWFLRASLLVHGQASPSAPLTPLLSHGAGIPTSSRGVRATHPSLARVIGRMLACASSIQTAWSGVGGGETSHPWIDSHYMGAGLRGLESAREDKVMSWALPLPGEAVCAG